MLQVHTIKSAAGARHRTKRVGRGNASGHGTTATRGGKGQTARSGGSSGLRALAFKRLLQSAPKRRGFTSLNGKPAAVYLRDLDRRFTDGAEVTLAALKESGIVSKNARAAKVVGGGTLTKKLQLSGLACTKGARETIMAAGGEVK